jgi:5-methylcytosine-specific restriction endonuclease McrA
MPIDPDQKKFYPKNWRQMSLDIRDRAHWRCEQCQLPQGALGGRTEAGEWRDALPEGDDGSRLEWPRAGFYALCCGGLTLKIIKIVLTVAHINQDPTDNRRSNLIALCQQCHNRLDATHRANSRRDKARRARVIGGLF